MRGPPGDIGLMGMRGLQGEAGRSIPGQYQQSLSTALRILRAIFVP